MKMCSRKWGSNLWSHIQCQANHHKLLRRHSKQMESWNNQGERTTKNHCLSKWKRGNHKPHHTFLGWWRSESLLWRLKAKGQVGKTAERKKAIFKMTGNKVILKEQVTMPTYSLHTDQPRLFLSLQVTKKRNWRRITWVSAQQLFHSHQT